MRGRNRDRDGVCDTVCDPTPHDTLFYGDRWGLMGVRSTGRKSLTVILFIVLGRPWPISGAASVNRRVVGSSPT